MMKTENLPIGKIKENPDNPRVIQDHNFRRLVKSIREFPKMLEIRPIVVNSEMTVLGGNMRLRACKEAGLKKVPVLKAEDLSPEQQREFIIKDNVAAGEWDWDLLANEWEPELLEDWGLDLPGFDLDGDKFGEEFSLPDGDKLPIQQITFTLADKQAEQIKNAISDIKKTEAYKYVETMGNENSNGNALYLIIMQWVEQKK